MDNMIKIFGILIFILVILEEISCSSPIKALDATSSSTGWGFGPQNAIDSNPDTFSHSTDNEDNPWLQVTFAQTSINGIYLTPRSGKESRMKNIIVRAGKKTTPLDNPVVGRFDGPGVDGSGKVYHIEFTQPVIAKRVTIQIEGKGTLNIGEVEVIKAGIDIIAATSSSTGWGFGPKNAIDSNPDTFSHSEDNEDNPWLQVTFAQTNVNGIYLTPRSGKESRMKNIIVRAGKKTTPLDNPVVGRFDGPGVDGSGKIYHIEFTQPVSADRVTVQIEGKGTLNIGEVEVIKSGTKILAATSSSTGWGYGPENAIDSNPDTFSHSTDNEDNPWLQVTFAQTNAKGISLTPRSGKESRMKNIIVRAGVLTTPLDNPVVGRFDGPGVDGSGDVYYIGFAQPVIADRVIVQIEGKGTLNIGEVEVIIGGTQVLVATTAAAPLLTTTLGTTAKAITSPPIKALAATSSSTGYGFGPKNAIDSNPDTFFHSTDNENNPWLQVTFAQTNVNGIYLTPRDGYESRIKNIIVRAGKLTTPLDNPVVGRFDGPGVDGSGKIYHIEFTQPVVADRVIIQIEGKATLNIGEVVITEKVVGPTSPPIKALAATSSSTGWGFGPKNAIDSNPDTFSHSEDNEDNPWLQVTFAETSVNGIYLTPRSGKESRMKNIIIRAGKKTTPLDNPVVGRFDGPGVDGSGKVYHIEFTPVIADRVTIQIEGKGTLNIGEVVITEKAGSADPAPVDKAPSDTGSASSAPSATSSSIGWGMGPKLAIDSDPATFFHSEDNENNPWLQVTFTQNNVNGIYLTPRSGKESRMKNIIVRAGKLTTPLSNPVVGRFDGPGVDGSGKVYHIKFTQPVIADRVTIQIEGKGTLNIAEVEVITAEVGSAGSAGSATSAPVTTQTPKKMEASTTPVEKMIIEEVTLTSPGNYNEMRAKHGDKLEKIMKDAIVAELRVDESHVQNVVCFAGSIKTKFDLVFSELDPNRVTVKAKVNVISSLIVDGEEMKVESPDSNIEMGNPEMGKSATDSATDKLGGIIGGVIGGVAGAVIIVCVALWWYKKKKPQQVTPE